MFKGELLKKLREELDMTQENLANIFNLSQSTINRYEKGLREPDTDILVRFANFFKVSLDYLLGRIDYKNNDLPKNAISLDDQITIPLLGTIRAGEPIYTEGNIQGYFQLPKSFLSPGEHFYLRVTGDSMNLDNILEGGYVLVRRQEEVENGEIAIVLVNGEEATIKRFYKNENIVNLMPKSSNPIHKPIIIDTKKVPVQVIGKVIWYLNKI